VQNSDIDPRGAWVGRPREEGVRKEGVWGRKTGGETDVLANHRQTSIQVKLPDSDTTKLELQKEDGERDYQRDPPSVFMEPVGGDVEVSAITPSLEDECETAEIIPKQ
jgi:hypothetical protein